MGSAAAAFRAAVEAGDMRSAIALLADDVVFNSPIVFRPYVGRDAVAPVLLGVAQVFADFHYTASYDEVDGTGHVLAFSATVGGKSLDGVDILRTSADRIVELTVLVRPYSAATALREQMAALLASG